MLALIIYGTKGVTSTRRTGRFHCPACGPDMSYEQKEVRRYFTLYFIPLIPMDSLGDYIECRRCAGTYKKDVLDFDPKAQQAEAEEEFRTVMRRVMVDIMMADGVMEETELKVLAEVYEKVGGKPLSKRRLNAELERLEKEGHAGTLKFLKESQGFLNEQGKEMVMRGALSVAAADGQIQEAEQDLLKQYARALELSNKRYSALIDEVLG